MLVFSIFKKFYCRGVVTSSFSQGLWRLEDDFFAEGEVKDSCV
jgi:hypothetical protein